jgi:UDPglucose--hexose-1-phosphate uridylyltransferase
MSEIRENPITGEWVVVAPERGKRGTNFVPAAPGPKAPAFLAACPFCPGNEAASDECFRACGGDGGWAVRSVVNKFSVLSPTGEVAHPGCVPAGEVRVNGVGLHEVIVESARHDAVMALYPPGHLRLVIESFRNRFESFYADPRVRHVILFKNHGADAGASQQHPHSQIVGLPIMPGQVVDRVERSRRFFGATGQCLACSIIANELAQGCRIIAENRAYVAFIPHAALSPYHLWIFPKEHRPCFSTGLGADALAEVLRSVLAKIYGMLGNPAFNLVVRSLGPREDDASHFHWYVSVVPRVNKRAGFELGTGMYINPSSPEDRARELAEFPAPAC